MTSPCAIPLGRIVDDQVRWQPPPPTLGPAHGSWPDPALTDWAQRRAGDHAPGPLAAVRAADGGLWQIILQPAADGPRLTALPWLPDPADAPLTSALLEATGFQISHTLRSPLSRLAGHHLLAQRALDAADPDAARAELQAAEGVVESQLRAADRIAETLAELVALPRQAPLDQDGRGLVAEAGELLTRLPETTPDPRLHLEVPAGGSSGGADVLATIEVAEPAAVPASAVAVVAAYLRSAWIVDAVIIAHDHRVWRLCGPSTNPPASQGVGPTRVRAIGAAELGGQALAVGRSIAQGSAAGVVGFAAAFAGLLQAGGEVALTRTAEAHRRLAALLALDEHGSPVLLDPDGELARP